MTQTVRTPFDCDKTIHFANLGLRVRAALKMHVAQGYWERTPEGARDWGNASEHCLVAAARANVFAVFLGFKEELRRDLVMAAALHDFFKKGEKQMLQANGLSYDSYDAAQEEAARVAREAGFSDRVVRLSGAVGHSTVHETERLLGLKALSDEDVAYLVMHYVDDYTIGSDWAKPAQVIEGAIINDLDRRMQKNEANPRYAVLNEEGRKYFNGETAYQASRRVGNLVERRLTELLRERAVEEFSEARGDVLLTTPKMLPEYIDGLIRLTINTYAEG